MSACDDEPSQSPSDTGADSSPDVTPDLAPACLAADGLSEPLLQGRIYEDRDLSDRSFRLHGFSDADSPVASHAVELLGTSPASAGNTCDDGMFAFGGLAEGVYLVDPGLPDESWPTTNNAAHHLLAAVREGSVRIVTFGDSIPVVGDEPFYPERLADMLGGLAEVEEINVAVGGSTSVDWMPGEDYFEDRLRPALAGADVVLISLGGNDGLAYVSDSFGQPGGIDAALDNLDAFILEVLGRIRTIVAEIRSENSNVDIVYGIYPDYASSDRWQQLLGPFAALAQESLAEALTALREAIGAEDRWIIVDLWAATESLDLDDYLYDELHLNDAGQQLYAEEILQALGGARVGEAPLGLVQDFALPGTP